MENLSFVFGPSWFYGIDSVIELVASIVTLLIAFYSFRVYLITKLRKYLYFMIAFILISASYFIRTIGDLIVFNSLIGRVPNLVSAVSTIAPLQTFFDLGILSYMVFMFAGFMILVAIFMRIDNFRTVMLLFLFVVLIAVLSTNKFLAFHATLIVSLFFIVTHLMMNYTKKRTFNSFLVLYSMTSLLFAQVFFLLPGAVPYSIAYALQLAGFLLLLLNMMLVFSR